ncbi:hypothetical protein [Jiangella alba]|uniref:hypothetical protein n=1 Tax=Jiangella alba TaxID=561176 RepID=UPI001495D642|nr:hypothetical protein [Jiangella alba]
MLIAKGLVRVRALRPRGPGPAGRAPGRADTTRTAAAYTPADYARLTTVKTA